VARLVLMDTGVFTGDQPMSDAWHRFADFVDRVDELPVSLLVRRGCATDPGDEVAAAYDAPFPSEAAKAGARAFPAILPLRPGDPGAAEGRRTLAALREDSRPALVLWGDADPVLPVRAGEALSSAVGWPAPRVVAGAGHFLQEDRGAEVGALIADWLGTQARRA
jgi:haloalkane dehalogenase